LKNADLSLIIALFLVSGCIGGGVSTEPTAILSSLEQRGEVRRFSLPRGIDVAPDGRIYVVDAETDELFVLSPVGDVLARFGGSGWRPGEFSRPVDVVYNPLTPSQVYLLDAGNDRVQKGDLIEGRFSVVGARTLSLSSPRGLDADTTGNIYIADTGNHRGIKFNPTTGELIELLPGELEEPVDVSVGAKAIFILDGTILFVCDRLGNMISTVKLPPDGEYSSVCSWRSGAIVTDRTGRLILVEGNRIQTFSDGRLRGIYGAAIFQNIIYTTNDDGCLKAFRLISRRG
jgi:DNA-binding beta-propeller fold protein YncE